jgi:hypothetical protein
MQYAELDAFISLGDGKATAGGRCHGNCASQLLATSDLCVSSHNINAVVLNLSSTMLLLPLSVNTNLRKLNIK